jgi:four helix bundle protein
MLHNFRSYQLAVQFYRQAKGLKLPYHLKDQFLRAASSVALNLSEGSAKETVKDRRRFYRIALGSIRECQAVIDLASPTADHLEQSLTLLAKHVFKLCKALE